MIKEGSMGLRFSDYATKAVTTQYEGGVLFTRERNYHDDSDFYAVCWTGEKLVSVQYDTTRYGGGGDATVDATAETWAAAGNWARESLRKTLKDQATDEAARVMLGSEVTVTKGRKFAKGRAGTVVGAPRVTWSGNYGRSEQVKALVQWADGSGADYVDVQNLTVTAASVAKQLAALNARIDAALDKADSKRLVYEWYAGPVRASGLAVAA